MKQTSIEWLFKQLWETPKDKFTWYAILKKAQEKHKQEIINAATWGGLYDTGEQYYQETFKKFTLMDETPSAPASDSTVMLPQQEISDEEILKANIEYNNSFQEKNGSKPPHIQNIHIMRHFQKGCEWYREKLKQNTQKKK